jgi:hypothetical protein
VLNFDFWDKEWPVITGAPHIVIGGALALIAIVFLIVRWGYSREVAGQKAQIATLNERLHLASDEQVAVTRQVTMLTSQVSKLEQQIERKEGLTALANTTAQVHGTIGDLSLANSSLGRTLTIPGSRVVFDLRPIQDITKKSDE